MFNILKLFKRNKLTLGNGNTVKKTFTEIVNYPDHEPRTESDLFIHNKEVLKNDGHWQCFISGKTENLEVHHFAAEWALSSDIDFKKLKEFCEIFDPYGYGKAMKDIPMTSVDDIRNLLVLNQDFHRTPYLGVHYLTLNSWIAQKICKDGCNPIVNPNQNKESSEK